MSRPAASVSNNSTDFDHLASTSHRAQDQRRSIGLVAISSAFWPGQPYEVSILAVTRASFRTPQNGQRLPSTTRTLNHQPRDCGAKEGMSDNPGEAA
jgi:hypothetical protein